MTDSPKIAVIAGGGDLPRLLAEALAARREPLLVVGFDGVVPAWIYSHPNFVATFEQLGALFTELKGRGVEQVVFAGGMARPALDVSRADPAFLAIAPALMASLQKGDDATLRFILGLFESEGFAVVGAHEVLPDLLPPAGLLAGPEAGPEVLADAARATKITTKLGEADVGQGAVVASGICLAVEAIGGTDRMLEGLSALPTELRGQGGVLYKAAKPGQELRVDMPAIGPRTVAAAAKAGVSAIVIAAGEVMVVEAEDVAREADALGVTVLVRRS